MYSSDTFSMEVLRTRPIFDFAYGVWNQVALKRYIRILLIAYMYLLGGYRHLRLEIGGSKPFVFGIFQEYNVNASSTLVFVTVTVS